MFPQLHFWQLPPRPKMILHDLPPTSRHKWIWLFLDIFRPTSNGFYIYFLRFPLFFLQQIIQVCLLLSWDFQGDYCWWLRNPAWKPSGMFLKPVVHYRIVTTYHWTGWCFGFDFWSIHQNPDQTRFQAVFSSRKKAVLLWLESFNMTPTQNNSLW